MIGIFMLIVKRKLLLLRKLLHKVMHFLLGMNLMSGLNYSLFLFLRQGGKVFHGADVLRKSYAQSQRNIVVFDMQDTSPQK